MSLFKFIFRNRSWRIGKASKFGKIEHKAGRLLGLLIFSIWILIWFNYYKIALGVSWITFACWLTYLLAHTFEKKLYGSYGPRG